VRARIIRFTDRMARAASVLAVLCLIAIVVSIAADAIGRYVFASPIAGVHAVVGGLLQPAMIFLGCALVARSDGHMRVVVVHLDRWPGFKRAVDTLFGWMIAAFWATLAWQAGARAYNAYVTNQWPVGEIAIPAIVSYGVVAAGCLLAFLAHFVPSGDPRERLE